MALGGHNAQTILLRRRHLLFPALLCLLLLVGTVRAEEDELTSLELYNGAQVETVSVGRSPRPASQTAENITVVTAREIEALNAHNLVDVLNLVAGVQLEYVRTPGSTTTLFLQGSNYNHILVLIDNVPINNLTNNFPDIGSVPVQMIERIEIVKGAASSSWGNALGGVINIITKSPTRDYPLSGLISASAGKASTIDGRTELTGTVRGLGYYLTGGKLRSDGLLPNNMVDLDHFYGKLHYDLPRQGELTLTTSLTDSYAGQLQVPERNLKGDLEVRQLLATLAAEYPLNDRFSVSGMFRTRVMESDALYLTISDRSIMRDVKDEEASYGSVFKVSYLDDLQRVVAGVDYDHLKVHVSQPQKRADVLRRSDDRVGVYLNDTFSFGRFAIAPSLRFDYTEISGDQFSPSLGVTYAVTDNSVVRAYTAKGYGITSLNLSDSLEKVWTSQFGIESADIPYLWLKGTFFRNLTWDVLVENPDGTSFKERQLKQGYEIEARTMPVFATSFSVGYTFVNASHESTDTTVKGIARHTLNLGAKYEDNRHLRVQVTGHYIDWNDIPEEEGRYSNFIWDLHLAKRFIYSDTVSAEVFGSIRNIFNASQYKSPLYKNPGLWGEAGIRCAF